MNKEEIIDHIENLICLVGEKEDLEIYKNKLKSRGKGIIKALIFCSAVIYPIGIMLYMEGESLTSTASIISNVDINDELVSFNAFKFMLLWSIVILMTIAFKQSINTLNNPYIKNCTEKISELDQNIKDSSIVDNMNLSKYCNVDILDEFKRYLISGRASNLKECMNYYNLDMHFQKIENSISKKGV